MRATPWLGLLLAGVVVGQSPPTARRAFVTLSLGEYLRLVEQADTAARLAARPAPAPELHLAELLSQRTRFVLRDASAAVQTTCEVELRGRPTRSVSLAMTGLVESARVEPAAGAALRKQADRLDLVAAEPGRYRVEVRGTAALAVNGGVSRLTLAPVSAPVATTEVDLPVGLAWTCPGATVALDEVHGERRVLHLALRRGVHHVFETRREVRGEEQSKTLARAVVVTLVSLRPEGARRHDVVLYEVSRGSLGRFAVQVPEGYVLDRLASDEGELPPVVDGRSLVAQRTGQLSGTGWLVLTAPPVDGASLSLAPVEPGVEVRARYVAVAATVAAEAVPEPAAAWQRVDLEDLPEAVRTAAGGLKLAVAWQAVGEVGEAKLAVETLPAAAVQQTVVGSRETTTLLTREGTLLHKDRLVLAKAGGAVEVRLAAGATLWSASVSGQPVRHVERDGAVLVPLALGTAAGTVVEIVVVERQAIAGGRSRVGVGLPELTAPVLAHQWRLLLPEQHRYRFAGGNLRPVPETISGMRVVYSDTLAASGSGQLSGRVTDGKEPLPGVTVTLDSSAGSRSVISDANGTYVLKLLPPADCSVRFELPGFQTVEASVRVNAGFATTLDASLPVGQFAEEVTVTAISEAITSRHEIATTVTPGLSGGGMGSAGGGTKSPRRETKVETQARSDFRDELVNLKQGLVGGVRPVPVTIPESGKSLLLAGALPPGQVRVELDVKAKR